MTKLILVKLGKALTEVFFQFLGLLVDCVIAFILGYVTVKVAMTSVLALLEGEYGAFAVGASAALLAFVLTAKALKQVFERF